MTYFGRATKIGMLWSWLASAGVQVIWLPTAMITARLLTPEDFGVTATATFFLQMANRLTQFGFNAALVKMKSVRDEHKSSVFVMNLGLGALSWLTLAISAPFVAEFFRSPATGRIMPIAAVSFLVVPLGTVPNALLVRDLRFRELTWCTWINSVTSSVCTIALALLGFAYWSLVYGQLAGAIASSLAKLLFAGWRPRVAFRWDAAHETFSFGMAIYAQKLLEYSALNFDSMTVGRTMGMATLGLYDKAFNLMATLIDRINQAGPTISFRVFAVIHEDEERLRRAYRKVIMSSTLIIYPVLAVLAWTAPQLFEVLFGARWVPAAVPFEILCLAGAMKTLNAYTSSVNEAAGRIWSEVWRQTIYVVLIVAGVVLLRRWGITGAAVGVLLATVVMTVLMHTLVHRVTAIRWSDMVGSQAPAVLCSAAVSLPIWAAERGVLSSAPAKSAALQLAVLWPVAALAYVAFVSLVPLASLKLLRTELIEDLWPPVRQLWQSVRAPRHARSESQRFVAGPNDVSVPNASGTPRSPTTRVPTLTDASNVR